MENCFMCLNLIESTNFHTINAHILDILDIIFENNILQLKQGQIICQDCYEQLQTTFDFKCMCVNTEDFLLPFELERIKETPHIDLKKLTVTKCGDKEAIEIPEGYEVCRFCLDLVNKNFIPILNETHKHMLETLIPNLIVTLNPVVCDTCFKLLQQHTMFINSCLSLQAKHKANCEGRIKECTRQTPFQSIGFCEYLSDMSKAESICKKSSKTVILDQSAKETIIQEKQNINSRYKENTVGLVTINKQCFTNEGNEENIRKGIKCKIDLRFLKLSNLNNKKEIKTKVNGTRERVLKPSNRNTGKVFNPKTTNCNPSISDQNLLEIKIYTCGKCKFQTAFEHVLKLHEFKHEEDHTKTQRYTCEVCPYETKFWNSLKLHKSIHKHMTIELVHKCTLCSFETKYKTLLEFHKLKHKYKEKTSSVKHRKRKSAPQKQECTICCLKTGNGRSKTKRFSCKDFKDSSSCQAKHERTLYVHLVRHKSNSHSNEGTLELDKLKCSYQL